MLTVLAYAAAAFALFWVVHDPVGSANTAAYVIHELGVWAATLAGHLSKPGLTGAPSEHVVRLPLN